MHELPDDATMARLRRAARAAQERAHAVHSGFQVGAAILTAGGEVFSGCNVESASYGLTLCAERSALAAWQLGARGGGGGGGRPPESDARIVAVVIATDAPTPTPPCGACRQWLAEFAPRATVISVTFGAHPAEGRWTVAELLPDAFTGASMGGPPRE